MQIVQYNVSDVSMPDAWLLVFTRTDTVYSATIFYMPRIARYVQCSYFPPIRCALCSMHTVITAYSWRSRELNADFIHIFFFIKFQMFPTDRPVPIKPKHFYCTLLEISHVYQRWQAINALHVCYYAIMKVVCIHIRHWVFTTFEPSTITDTKKFKLFLEMKEPKEHLAAIFLARNILWYVHFMNIRRKVFFISSTKKLFADKKQNNYFQLINCDF